MKTAQQLQSASPSASESTPETDRIAELWTTLRTSEDPVGLLRRTLASLVSEERSRCAFIAETASAPEERMPWRYRLRFRLRPEVMTRQAIRGTRLAIAARIRDRRA